MSWVVAGGETGPRARPMNIEWAYDLLRQCNRAKVPFFMKALGEWCPRDGVPEPLLDAGGYHHDEMFGEHYVRLGKKAGIPISLNVKQFPEVPEKEE